MNEEVKLEKSVTSRGITEIKGYIDSKVDTKDLPIELGAELLISLDSHGYKFSNFKMIAYRKGTDSAKVSEEIIRDLTLIKTKFLENVADLLE